jgi:hypothetical protein
MVCQIFRPPIFIESFTKNPGFRFNHFCFKETILACHQNIKYKSYRQCFPSKALTITFVFYTVSTLTQNYAWIPGTGTSILHK